MILIKKLPKLSGKVHMCGEDRGEERQREGEGRIEERREDRRRGGESKFSLITSFCDDRLI